MDDQPVDTFEDQLRRLCDRGEELRQQLRTDLEAAAADKERQRAIVEQHAQAQALLREEMAAIERQMRGHDAPDEWDW